MMRRVVLSGIVALSLFSCVAPAETESGSAVVDDLPSIARNFRLNDHVGGSHELYRYRESKAIVLFFAGNGCPIVRKSIATLKEIRDAYREQGVEFLMINGNPGDDLASVVEEASEFSIDFPILMDEAQTVTDAFQVDRTATTFVITPGDWKIVYRGAIDDRLGYGVEKPEPAHHWLTDALDAVLTDQPVETPFTEAKGCLIDRLPEPKKISYSRHIAPVLREKCATCHREGDIAPFPMDSYEEVVDHKRMIREVVMTKRMPPWHADPHYGDYDNDNGLSPDETRRLLAWLDMGAPRGRGQDPLAKVKPMESAWPLGEPDIVVAMPASISVPATGVLDYEYVRVPYDGTEDIWVRATDVLPGARSVVHHALVFIRYPEHLRHLQPDYEGGLDGFFAGYVPGMTPSFFPEGTAKFVPAGSEFVFQLHYSTTGKAADDVSKLGLYLNDGKPKRELFTRAASNTELAIPPGDPGYQADAKFRVRQDTVLYSMSPHMHYRGKNFKYVADFPDGSSEVLLNVPNYDFNWQTMYRFQEPKVLPAGTVIRCEGAYDNSIANPMNPDPESWVYFGEQTFEEMFIGYLRYAYVDEESGSRQQDGAITEGERSGLGVPITAESIVGTMWRSGRFRIRFLPDGELRVGRGMRGTWRIEGDHVIIHVANDDHTLRIEEDRLIGDDGPLPNIGTIEAT
jgi:peroxiredoxin